MKSMNRYFLVVFLSVFVFKLSSNAMTLDWTGNYRFEYTQVDSSTLSSSPDRGTKGYFLNHLNLSPKIIAMDGFNVVANLEIFPSMLYPSSQLGSDFGSSSTITSYNASLNQSALNVEVNQLYLNWNHEYGALVAGRAPIQFGLGITHNAGNGLYDHWLTTHDMVGYKFLIGNMSIMPIIGKTFRGASFSQSSVSTDQIWDLEYSNAETESAIGVFHQIRSASDSGNDGRQFFKVYDTGTPSIVGGWNTTTTNLYLSRGWSGFKFKMEAGFQSGGTGIKYSTGTGEIKMSGYGIATEMEFPNPESKYQWMIKMGIASGDDPRTENFEGFFFDKNYDIAFLLFNHSLGANNYDVLRTNLNRQRDPANAVYKKDRTADEETVSNTIYFSPKLTHEVSDKWQLAHVFTYAQVQTNPSLTLTNVQSDLGVEYDFRMIYKPQTNFQWLNEIGFFSPGSVWKEASANREANFTYGFQSKIVVSF